MATAISRAKLGMNVGDTERIGSTIAGLALISRAVAKPTLGRIVLAVAGAALLQRGVTGRCSLYKRSTSTRWASGGNRATRSATSTR